MKRIITLICAVVILLIGTQAFAGGLGGTFSEGYRMGQLTKFSVKGMINKSGEGQMLLGRESSPYENEDGKKINPWYFFAEKGMYDSLNNYVGDYVVIEYEQSRIKNGFSQETDYTVQAVYPVTKKNPNPPMFAIDKPSGSKSEGKRVGRIVKVSKKGQMKKTWEIIVQIGNEGNQFKHMTIQDEDMCKYAVQVLKSAKKVTIYYVEDYVEIMADTGYKIWKIEMPDDI